MLLHPKKIGVITYKWQKIHPRNPAVKMGAKKKYYLFGIITYFFKKIPPRNLELSKIFEKEKLSCEAQLNFSKFHKMNYQFHWNSFKLMVVIFLISSNLKFDIYKIYFYFSKKTPSQNTNFWKWLKKTPSWLPLPQARKSFGQAVIIHEVIWWILWVIPDGLGITRWFHNQSPFS